MGLSMRCHKNMNDIFLKGFLENPVVVSKKNSGKGFLFFQITFQDNFFQKTYQENGSFGPTIHNVFLEKFFE